MNEPKAKSLESGKKGESVDLRRGRRTDAAGVGLSILEPAGYTIETFRAPESALGAFQAADPPPALLITDYAMHAMNGLELAEACRRIRPQQRCF